MDQTTNPLEKILQLCNNYQNLGLNQQQESSFPSLLDNLSFASNILQSKIIQKHQFFAISPDPFKKLLKQPANYNENQFKKQQNNLQDIKKQTLYEDLKWFSLEKQSQFNFQQFQIEKKNLFFNQKVQKQKLYHQTKREASQIQSNQVKQHVKHENHKQKIFSSVSDKLLKQHDDNFSQIQNENLIQTNCKLNNKNQRGLKNLSQIVLKIVKRHKKLTYNEVAEKLIEMIRKIQEQQGKFFDEKDQKNIKRRAYDSLNVMISTGIIEKKARYIMLKESEKIEQIQIRGRKRVKLEENSKKKLYQIGQQTLNQLTQQIQLKKIEQQNSKHKLSMLKRFFNSQNRNLSNPNKQHIIPFPFLCIQTKTSNLQQINKNLSSNSKNSNNLLWQKQNDSTCDQSNFQEIVTINFKQGSLMNGIKIYGDVDLITEYAKQLNKHDQGKQQIFQDATHQKDQNKLIK